MPFCDEGGRDEVGRLRSTGAAQARATEGVLDGARRTGQTAATIGE
jgi:hypothetical protein